MNKYYTCNKCNQEKADYLGNCFDCDMNNENTKCADCDIVLKESPHKILICLDCYDNMLRNANELSKCCWKTNERI